MTWQYQYCCRNSAESQCKSHQIIFSKTSSDYKSRLTNLNLLPLMYVFEISDIVFFINNIKLNIPLLVLISAPMYHFHTVELDLLPQNSSTTYLTLTNSTTSTRICRLCNSLTILNLTFNIKNQLRKFSGNTSLKISMLPILISYTLSLPLQLVHQQLPHKLRSSLVRIMNSQ